MTYRWDDDDETTIQINDTKIEQEIDAKKGTHTLKVVVVDIDNKTDTKEQTIKGVSKPKVVCKRTLYIISIRRSRTNQNRNKIKSR